MITEKTCAKCGEVKPVSDFYVDNKAASGFTSYCKACKGIKGEVRYTLPSLCPQEWQYLFCVTTQCVRCDGKTDLFLYLDGSPLPLPSSMDDAKGNARKGEVICKGCAASVPTLRQRVKSNNRKTTLDERIAATDFLLEEKTQMATKPYLKRFEDDDPMVHDIIVDAFAKRHTTKEQQDDLNERFPVITESKGKTIRKREGGSYDQIFESWQKNEDRWSHD